MTTVASEIKSGEQRAKEAAVSIASGCTRYAKPAIRCERKLNTLLTVGLNLLLMMIGRCAYSFDWDSYLKSSIVMRSRGLK